MKKFLFITLAFVFCTSVSAQPYISKHFKNECAKTYCNKTYGGNDDNRFAPSHRTSDFINQSKTQNNIYGETYYVMLTNANARNTVNWSPDGETCATVWTLGAPPMANRPRGTGINYYDYATSSWNPIPSVDPLDRIEEGPLTAAWVPGWGTHVFTEQGECVIAHCVAEGGMVVNYRDKRGEGKWNQSFLIGPTLSNGKTDIMWPTTFAVGNTIHMVCITTNTSDVTYEGIPTCPLYYRSTDGGKSWETVRTFDGTMPLKDQKNIQSDEYVLTAKGDHVVLAYGCGNAAYLESFDGGDTWEYHVVYDAHWDWYSTGEWVGPIMFASTIAAAIDDNDKVHITFGAQIRSRKPDDGELYYWYYYALCGMYTWKEGQPVMTEDDMGIEFDYANDKWVTLNYDLLPNFMDAPDILGFDRFYWWSDNAPDLINKSFGNVGYISHPRLIAKDGKVYLLYSSIIEEPLISNEPDEFYRGVFMTVSKDNGDTYDQNNNTSWLSYHPNLFWCDWDYYEGPNVEDTTYGGFIEIITRSDNGYPTMATSIMNNSLVCTWENDIKVFPEDAMWLDYSFSLYGNILKTWEAGVYNRTCDIWKNSSVDENTMIKNFQLFPNPAENRVTVNIENTNSYTLTVTNIMGQIMYSTKGQGKTELNVANYPAGVYIVNVKTAHASASQKLIVK
ncbi:MAG: T9SS type A sorting domain-containing protein [Bacteroidales bacterium]|jgi:hypothetical protein|nr:T9SS type A sorting domain-containing protein [Bacteroidales bacterium]